MVKKTSKNYCSRNCVKLSVVVPVYNEEITTIQTLINSFLKQKDVQFTEFDVNFIVSNSKIEAKNKTNAFRQNQSVVKFFSKITAKSKLNIKFIDRSSLEFAPVYENANSARQYCALKVAQKFCKNCKEKTVIAFIDADCEVSTNYVFESIGTFRQEGVNRVFGNLLWQGPPGKHKKIYEMASVVHFGKNYLAGSFKKQKKNLPLRFFTASSNKLPPVAGQNLIVALPAWRKVGGIGKVRSYDDILFARRVDKLTGFTVFNPNFSVITQFRPSSRAGLVGLGQRIKQFEQSLESFLKEKQKHLEVIDWQTTNKMLNEMLSFGLTGKLTAEKLVNLASNYGQDWGQVKGGIINRIAHLINLEFQRLAKPNNIRELERLVLKHLLHRLPIKVIKN